MLPTLPHGDLLQSFRDLAALFQDPSRWLDSSCEWCRDELGRSVLPETQRRSNSAKFSLAGAVRLLFGNEMVYGTGFRARRLLKQHGGYSTYSQDMAAIAAVINDIEKGTADPWR